MISFIMALIALILGYCIYGRIVERVAGPTDNPERSVRHLWAMLASESSLTGVNSMADLPVQERLRRTKRKAG